MNVLAHRRTAVEWIFIATEGIAWFIAIAVLATLAERSFIESLADRLQSAIGLGDFANPVQAEMALADLRAVQGQSAGPPVLVVLGAAAGGFALMRTVPRLDLGPGLTSAVLVAATILGVNVLLHLSMGDLRLWDASRLVALFDDPGAQSATGVDLQAFVADPRVEGPHATALGITFFGLVCVWFRFMLAARAPVRLERMARSFTGSFIAVFIALFFARAGDVEVAGQWAVPHFVLGMLGLAIGNHERAVPVGEAEDRATPWMTSVGGSLGLLLGSAGLIGLLAYLEFGSVLSAAGDVLLALLEVVAIIIVTPLYWIVSGILTLLLGGIDVDANLPDMLREPLVQEDTGESGGDDGIVVPGWLLDTLKFFAFILVIYAMYWVGRRIVSRKELEREVAIEVRERRTGGAGIGQLLAGLVPFRRRTDGDRWMNRNEVYRLFRRALSVSDDRGLRRLPQETPDEFAHSALTHLASPPIADAARLFERARYGRHEPSREEVRNATRALARWDEAHPATEEGRARIRGHRPISDDDELRVRISRARRGMDPTDDAIVDGM